ncbi:MCP four helix bundle domain-containing protein [Cesiribacter sp. SM1]|uniref:MCP four helix bundle domain-containing protein n=1 Tax=Cesiribacter sp. SM1 TaxID=2861196 RepID=UPI001CD5ABDA|nr:MCP four helix bundle domain-containing protein [Cesiribacter sp. SM1]
MRFFAKIRWIASILLVFLIVLITNLIDRDNFNRLSSSVTTMYEDRIVASDLLFEMSKIIQEKEIAILTSDTLFLNNQNIKYNQELNQLVEEYRLTKLTEKERLVFNQLQEELESLKQKERSSTNISNGELIKSINKIDHHLYDLSKIQLQEGRRQVFISDKAKDTINLFTQGEIIFLVIMAVLIQIIILYKPKELNEK